MWWLGMLVLCALPWAGHANFEQFVSGLEQEARQQGLQAQLIRQSFGAEVAPLWEAKTKSKPTAQPEFAQTFQRYVRNMVSPQRLQTGREKYQQHLPVLQGISKQTGIPPYVITALWGVESHYGQYQGKFPILPSLATLAYQSHRQDFFRKEFFQALQIVQEGHVPLADFKGSWAGAMGQNQFMPSSFLAYAQDGNQDGRKDIWQTEADIFASTANYLQQNGWRSGTPWGQRVVLSKYLPADLRIRFGISAAKPIAEWYKLGVRPAYGELPPGQTSAKLFIPEGPSQKAYLVYHNFDVIMRWNRSTAFAFSVLTLADQIKAPS